MLGGRKNPKIGSRKDAKHVLTSKGPHFVFFDPFGQAQGKLWEKIFNHRL
jgi:hypothetical protein